MHIIDNVHTNEKRFPNVVLTVGSFDGVHKGHQRIIQQLVDRAKEIINGTPALLTMNPHPREFFSPNNVPNLLTSFDKKMSLLEEAGIEVVYIMPFNAETAAIEPERFIHDVLVGRCHVKSLIVGHDCRFGKHAQGDFALLESFANESGYDVQEIQPVLIEAERVSSTLVRERILAGDLPSVENLLGRPYSISGQVTTGRGIGRTIGFPTANIRPYHTAIPAQGVYIAESIINGEHFPSAVNIGIAPTIRNEDITIETHILDFEADLHGKDIEVLFHQRLRPERKFPNKAALVEQIEQDISTVRSFFA